MINPLDLSLYLVTDRLIANENSACDRTLETLVEEAVRGGVSIVQLREKDCSTAIFYNRALELKQVLSKHKVPLIINDRLDIALAVDAEGVHIGQSDMPYHKARQLLGDNKIIGLSVENIFDAEKANDLDVDYIAVSPLFSTTSKKDTAPALGLDNLEKIVSISRHPVIAIGGVNIANVKDVISRGAKGVAVISAILAEKNVREAAQMFHSIINKNTNNGI